MTERRHSGIQRAPKWAECRACGLVFSSDRGFDKHRVGKHAYTYSEGAKMDPPREDGRRCLTVDELQGRGFSQDEHGYWRMPARHVAGNPHATANVPV